MIVEFANGALGSFEATRFAPGRKNYNYFEIYGSKGSLLFDLERMNELQFFSQDDPAYAQGFRTILATEGGQHDYVANWWPPGHIIGYEHEFVHAVVDFVQAVVTKTKIEPNFYDGMKELEVLEAGLQVRRDRKGRRARMKARWSPSISSRGMDDEFREAPRHREGPPRRRRGGPSPGGAGLAPAAGGRGRVPPADRRRVLAARRAEAPPAPRPGADLGLRHGQHVGLGDRDVHEDAWA